MTSWSCLCGRSFQKSKKCLRCGDDKPALIEKGILPEAAWAWDAPRYKLWRNEYLASVEIQKKATKHEVDAAVAEIKGWIRG